MRALIGFFMGLLFGLGLILGGMTSPDKVLAFLDVAGAWDPSLAFVMGGAVMVALPCFAFARGRTKPLAGERFDQPGTNLIDRRLIGGSALFGIGWGLAGICPGPALVSLALAPQTALVFVVPMLLGCVASAIWRRKSGAASAKATPSGELSCT